MYVCMYICIGYSGSHIMRRTWLRMLENTVL